MWAATLNHAEIRASVRFECVAHVQCGYLRNKLTRRTKNTHTHPFIYSIQYVKWPCACRMLHTNWTKKKRSYAESQLRKQWPIFCDDQWSAIAWRRQPLVMTGCIFWYRCTAIMCVCVSCRSSNNYMCLVKMYNGVHSTLRGTFRRSRNSGPNVCPVVGQSGYLSRIMRSKYCRKNTDI